MVEEKRGQGRRAAAETAFLLLLAIATFVSAQPGRRNVLDDVQIHERGNAVVVDVSFSFPIRYVKHFPIERGDEIRIELETITVSKVDRDAIFGRESLASFAYDDRAPIERVIYEGDVEPRPFLTIEFEHAVVFRVEQGEDFRSLRIVLPGPRENAVGRSDQRGKD